MNFYVDLLTIFYLWNVGIETHFHQLRIPIVFSLKEQNKSYIVIYYNIESK